MTLRARRSAVAGVDLLALSGEIVDVALSAGTDGDGETDGAALVDDDRRAVTDARLFEPEATGLRELTLRVEVCEEGEADAAQTLCPCLVAILGVDGDTQDLGVCRLETRLERFRGGNFLASSGREVEGIEEQHDVLLAIQVFRRNRLVKVIVQLERWGLVSNLDHLSVLVDRCGFGSSDPDEIEGPY